MATDAKWSDFGSMDKEKLLAATNQLLPPWVALLLALLLAWKLSQLIWSLVPGPEPVIIAPQVAQSSQSSTAATQMLELNTITGAHLFGEADKTAAIDTLPVPVETEVVAETTLNLKLKGTIAASDQALALAIIEDNQKQEKVYAIGDAVVSGTKLHAVYADRVILNRSGNLEALKLPREFEPDTTPTARDNRQTARASSNNIRNAVAENVTAISEVLRPTPYFVGGQQQGYRVYPGKNRRQFASLGLRPGDLIKDIGGTPLTDPTQAMQIFQSLGDTDEVTVTVERNGEPQVLTLRTSQLNTLNDSPNDSLDDEK